MKKTLLGIAAGLALAASAQAATVSASDSYGMATTNWMHTLTLAQFDGSLGTLNSVTINYGGTFNTAARAESLDAAPSTVTVNVGGSLDFGGPISDILAISGSASHVMTAFDGTIDFGGTSGFDFGTLTNSDSGSITLTTGLASFIGAGSWSVDVAATGAATGSGAGNLITAFNTEALAGVEVIYDYTVPTVPEPASLGLLGLALAGVAAARRRKA